eukprot:scaffold8266_cov69-Isochrysis_galbana.AAC.2
MPPMYMAARLNCTGGGASGSAIFGGAGGWGAQEVGGRRRLGGIGSWEEQEAWERKVRRGHCKMGMWMEWHRGGLPDRPAGGVMRNEAQ